MGRQQAEMAAQQKCKTRYRFTKALLSHLRWYGVLTLWAPMGGKAPALGIGPTRGLLVGGGGLAPFVVGLHEWSVKRVLMSGFGRGFLQSWCCQFKLKENEDHLRNNSHTREQGATRRHDALYFPTKKTTRVTEMERKKEECNICCANWSIIYQISKGKKKQLNRRDVKQPLVYQGPKPWTFEGGKSKFVTKKRICLDKLFKFYKHNIPSWFGVSILWQLLILPVKEHRRGNELVEQARENIRKAVKLAPQKKWKIRVHLKLSRVSNWVISLNKSSLKEAKTFRSLTRISTALARSCLIYRRGRLDRSKSHQ